jgi:hypothetical protein
LPFAFSNAANSFTFLNVGATSSAQSARSSRLPIRSDSCHRFATRTNRTARRYGSRARRICVGSRPCRVRPRSSSGCTRVGPQWSESTPGCRTRKMSLAAREQSFMSRGIPNYQATASNSHISDWSPPL